MALSYSWGYTNTTAGGDNYNPIIIDMINYAVTADQPKKCVIKNITSPIDQPEVITFMCDDRQSISTTETNLHPAPNTAARMISVKVENFKRELSSVDDHYIVDYPIINTISWRFSKNKAFSADDLMLILRRALGAIRDSDGHGSRLDNMMMEQLNPMNA